MHPPSRGRVVVLTCVPAFMVALDNLVVTTALPSIGSDLGASVEQLAWTVSAYVLAAGALMLAGALLGDRLGRRRMFVAGLAVFTVASAGAALAPSVGWLVAARALQGCGAALVQPLSLALVSAAFPAGARGAAIGIWGAVTGAAVAVGPIVGGAIADGLSWQWIFWVNVPIGAAAAALAPRLLAESHGAARRVDAVGLAAATGGLAALVWGITRGDVAGWGSGEVLATLVAGAAALALFAAREARADEPLVPRAALAERRAAVANGAAFLMTAALFGAAFVVPQYLQTALGADPLEAGLRLLPWTAAALLVTPAAGAFADRIGDRALMVAGLSLQAAGFAWLAAVAGPDTGYGAILWPLLVAGVGVSLVFPAVANAVVGRLAGDELTLASAASSTFREVGGLLGVAVAAAVFAANGAIGTPELFVDGLVPTLAVCAALSAGGAAVAAAGGARRRAAGARTAAAAPGVS